ncbi:MAG: sigma-70 family RNA polymerase sigma factor [Taibaiella sp.]|nr:sigma-70 family RNA polymerase sigma factor [Taibaiella sp.]
MADEELLQAYRRTADNQWLGYLLHRYTLLLLGVAMKYLKDRTEAEDAVQQIFLKALTHLPKEEIANFKGWLYILMRNHCLQQLRDKTRFADEQALSNVPAAPGNHDELMLHEYNLEQMTEAIKHLNDEQRTTITMFYLQKKSYDQIIMATGYTFMQVKSFIQNGKRNLKTILLKKLSERGQ